MPDNEDTLDEKFQELSRNFEKLHKKKALVFSPASIADFCSGFDQPVIGLLEYLKQKTSTHFSIQCITSCNQLNEYLITDYPSYSEFANALIDVTPPVAVNFSFQLINSIYPIGDISETFSVYFSKDGYQIVYPHNGYQELRFEKQYNSHIEPDEIKQLRNVISNSIIKKVTVKLDALL